MTTSSTGNLATLVEPFAERSDGQYIELTLTNPATDLPIPITALGAVRGTLRSLDTGKVFYSDTVLTPGTRVAFPADGRLRVLLLPADLATSGGTAVQRRRLTLDITYNGSKHLLCAVDFPVRNFSAVF